MPKLGANSLKMNSSGVNFYPTLYKLGNMNVLNLEPQFLICDKPTSQDSVQM